MHRNTKLLVVLLAIFAALVIGVNIGKGTGNGQPALSPTPAPTAIPSPALIIYNSARCGITFLYPNNLKLNESSTSSTMIVDPGNPTALPITLICQPSIPRIPLPPEKIDRYIIKSTSGPATASATLYHDTSPKDGTPIDKLIFTNAAKHIDVFISGFGNVYLKTISSLKLL